MAGFEPLVDPVMSCFTLPANSRPTLRDPFSSSVRICRSTHINYRQSAWMHKETLHLVRIEPSDSYGISITFTKAVFPQSFSAKLKCTYGLCP